ncbi:MAG TPA: hypothetical protein VF618_06800 [Thermoanaerobaculia bacterium]
MLLLLAGVFIAYKMIPVKVRTADLRQTVTDEARAAGTHEDPQIIRAILGEAERLNLPVGKEDIEIVRRRDSIRIDVKYMVPVPFPGFTYEWNFHHVAENPIF